MSEKKIQGNAVTKKMTINLLVGGQDGRWAHSGTARQLTILEMVVSSLFWFHMSASVVRWPSAASRICSTVQSMDSFARFCSNQSSSYQPAIGNHSRSFHKKSNITSYTSSYK